MAYQSKSRRVSTTAGSCGEVLQKGHKPRGHRGHRGGSTIETDRNHGLVRVQ